MEKTIEELGRVEPSHADLLMQRFAGNLKISQIAAKMHMSMDHVNRLQRSAIASLADFLGEKEAEFVAETREQLLAKLPPASFSAVIGRAAFIRKICRLVEDPRGPRIVELVGLGGLGKTAVAHAASRSLIEAGAISDIAWVQADQSDSGQRLLDKLSETLAMPGEPTYQSLRSLQKKLKQQRYLVVFDSLSEQLSDLDWLHQLAEMCEPSRFLLTGRVLPNELAPVYTVRVGEVSAADAKAIARQQAAVLGLAEQATPDLIDQLYERTGGNPLAIKLAVGLLRMLPVSTALSALEKGNTTKTEVLFRDIYAHCWQGLDDKSRALLLPTVNFTEEGARLEQLRGVSELSERDSNDAALSLSRLSLLELRAVGRDQKYGTHRLTRSFLQTQTSAMPDLADKQSRSLLKHWQREIGNSGAKAIVAAEEANLMHAITTGIRGKQARRAAQLLASVYPGLHRARNREQWLQLYEQTLGNRLSPGLRGTLLFQIGSLLLQAEKPSKAEKQFRSAIELAASQELMFKCHLGSALAHYEQGDVRTARKGLASAANRASASNRLQTKHISAVINYLQKQYAAADEKLASVLKKRGLLTPKVASRVHMNRALVQLALRNPRHALKQLRFATQALPLTGDYAAEHSQLELLRSFVLYKMRDLPKAEAALQRAHDAAPESGEPAHRAFFETSLGRIHLANKKSAEAADFLKSAAKLWKKLGQPMLAADAASLLLLTTSDDSAGS